MAYNRSAKEGIRKVMGLRGVILPSAMLVEPFETPRLGISTRCDRRANISRIINSCQLLRP